MQIFCQACSYGLGIRKRFFTRAWESGGVVVVAPKCWSLSVWKMLSDIGFEFWVILQESLPAGSQELDTMILVSAFQHDAFYI